MVKLGKNKSPKIPDVHISDSAYVTLLTWRSCSLAAKNTCLTKKATTAKMPAQKDTDQGVTAMVHDFLISLHFVDRLHSNGDMAEILTVLHTKPLSGKS